MRITYFHWNEGQTNLKELTTKIIEVMKSIDGSICIVKDVPVDDNNEAFLAIANNLGGKPICDYRMPSHSLESDRVIYRVEEDSTNTDEHAYSATNRHFSLHTDCAHFLHPPEIMMLLCCRPSPNVDDGKTILVHVNEIIKRLNANLQNELVQFQFPWWNETEKLNAPILTIKGNEKKCYIRFNKRILQREMGEDAFEMSSTLQSLIEILNSFETNPNNTISLNTGDLLIVHNQRVLHGRTAFPSGSKRLLKRIRVRVPDL